VIDDGAIAGNVSGGGPDPVDLLGKYRVKGDGRVIDYLIRLWRSDMFSPHGLCLLWDPGILWSQAIGDALMGLSFVSVGVFLAVLAAKRQMLRHGWLMWLFSMAFLLCAGTHFFAVLTLWVPDYAQEALLKLLTAALSVTMAVLLWPLLPTVLAMPTTHELHLANTGLIARMNERDVALAALKTETEERQLIEQTLRHAEKLQALGRLTGGIAHDFNNLLTVVLGNLDRVARKTALLTDVQTATRNAILGAERAARLTSHLLSFARNQPLLPSQQIINELVQTLVDMTERSMTAAVTLTTSLDPDLWPVRIDADHLQVALLNLIVNATDAMPDGGTLRISTRNLDPAHVMVEVSDTGCGMTQDVLNQAIEPFFTTKPLGKGTGVGLSQVYGFVTQSAGRLDMQSVPGKGTTIQLVFPRATLALQASEECECNP
jgi:signal transduction histidine kinase